MLESGFISLGVFTIRVKRDKTFRLAPGLVAVRHTVDERLQDVEVLVNPRKLAREYGARAVKCRTGQTKECRGCVVVRPRRTHV